METVIINNKLYRYSNTEHFSENKDSAHCTIFAQSLSVINMTEIWSEVKNWDLLDKIIKIRNDATHRRRAVKVNFDNDDYISIEINGTVKSITDYYAVGKTFNLGRVEDKMAQVTSIEFLEA